MLDLKAKLLKAGLVTADQVKKVEDEEAEKKRRKEEARERKSAPRQQAPRARPPSARPDADEKRAAREHQEVESERWRKRLDELKAAGKSDVYDAVRGWVVRHRLDDKVAIPSENATRFHFARDDGTIGHITLEPEVQAKVTAGAAGIVTFMGHNGLEHAVVPTDLAKDIQHVKPEWLKSLVGVTDIGSESSGDSGTAEASAKTSAAEQPITPEV